MRIAFTALPLTSPPLAAQKPAVERLPAAVDPAAMFVLDLGLDASGVPKLRP